MKENQLLNSDNNVRKGFARNLEERKKYFDEKKVYTIEVGLAPYCQAQCTYCYASSTPDWDAHLPKHLLFGLVKDAIDLDVKQINWGGGEPLMRKDWPEILEYSKNYGLENLLMTNGIPLADREIASKVCDLVDMAFIHIDSIDPNVWDKLHKSPKKFNHFQINGIKNLLEMGFQKEDLAVSMTITKPLLENEDYKKTIDWAYDELGVSVILFPYRPYGFGKDTMDLRPKNEETWKVYEYRNSKDGIGSGPGFGSKFYCGTKTFITATGDMVSCSMVPTTKIGNLYKHSFKELHDKFKDMMIYSNLHDPKNIKGKCATCEKNEFCWGCRALSFLECGDYSNSNEVCGY